MNQGKYERLSTIVGRALELRGKDRNDFILDACGDDLALKQEVDSLLWNASQDSPILDLPLVRPKEPERIGPYRLLARIADGGMGTVYRVKRQDDFELEAALKLVRMDRRSKDFVDQFHRERQTLATLEHPGIARILDGGTTDRGLPYFVMEWVNGQPLTTYCDAHRLSVRQRIEIFLDVCAALSFAHRNFVVHRDLKPEHILVNPEGKPKLIDFGIAHPLSIDAREDSIEVVSRQWMTLPFASPEQIKGLPATAASDLYSLGVVLYCLLTGETPLGTSSELAQEAHRRTTEDQPRQASETVSRQKENDEALYNLRNTSARDLQRALEGDLDCILNRTLHRKPEERYGSVAELAEDLQRYLDGHPVLAREGGWGYRTGRFFRRHYLAATAAGLVFIMAVTAGIVFFDLWRQAANQRGQAETLGAALGSVFVATDPNQTQGKPDAGLDILDRAQAAISVESPGAELEGSPDHQASLFQQMGRAYLRFGAYEKAQTPLEKALTIRRASGPKDSPGIAESLHDLAHALDKLGDPRARQLTIEAVEIQRSNGDHLPLELARGLTILGRHYYDDGLYKDGQQALLEALEVKRSIPNLPQEELVITLSNLAATWHKLGREQEAVETYGEVLEIRRRTLGSMHTDVARSLSGLATILRDLGRYEEATEALAEALEIRQQLLGPDHPDTARLHRAAGTILQAQGDREAAGHRYEEALRLQRAVLPKSHPEIAVTRTKQASLHRDLGQTDLCRSLARQAINALETSEQPSSGRLKAAKRVLEECEGTRDAPRSVGAPRNQDLTNSR